MTNSIQHKLEEIADCLCKQANTSKYADTGLFGNTMGILLFLSYYKKFTNSENYDNTINLLLDKLFDKIGQGIYHHTYCAGISGTLYGLDFLQRKSLIDIDISEAIDYYYQFLKNKMLKDIAENNNDFLHGATGLGIYFSKYREQLKSEDILIQYLSHLESSGIYSDNTVKWPSFVNEEVGSAYNIALSHGMSGIAVFISKLLQSGIETERTKKLLTLTVNYILRQEIDKDIYGSYFPYTSIESCGDRIDKSRLAWCYGDLGVASALWQVSKITSDNSLEKKTIEVFEFGTTRLDLESNKVTDACICHGTAGIAQIFRRMYLDTKNEKFISAHNYWINETLKMAKWEDGAAGYKSWSGVKPEWINDYGFLEGISGIGLALLATVGDESYSDWDELLLLS